VYSFKNFFLGWWSGSSGKSSNPSAAKRKNSSRLFSNILKLFYKNGITLLHFYSETCHLLLAILDVFSN
jgi:hypothetical protein